jgi:hypothetical protein
LDRRKKFGAISSGLNKMITHRLLLKLATTLIANATVFGTLAAIADITEFNAKRIKQDYPVASTMGTWLQASSDTYAMNPVNVRAGKHPDYNDPEGGPYDVLYIFPDVATANAWWDPIAQPSAMPTTIPDTAVAFIDWQHDNDSGSFPGVMSKSDVDGRPPFNCIMAAGDTITLPGAGDIQKTCSNPLNSEKRFKLHVLIPDVPIDLVFNVEQQPLTYTNYVTLPTYDGIEESGRLYQVLQQWTNATGTDTATQVRDGVRIGGFRLEIGYGTGSAFMPIDGAAADGLDPDKALGFEIRTCMPDHFFDIFRDHPGTGTSPCSSVFDTTGQLLPVEIWFDHDYATFEPRMYSFPYDPRMLGIGIPGGYFEKRPGGIYPPEIQTLGKIDTGYKPSDDPIYWATRTDGALSLPGYVGATSPNYFDIVSRQATDVGATTAGSINAPSPFGYLMYTGVFADDDYGILPQGVYRDDDGLPSTRPELYTWWDGDEHRWSIDGPVFDGVVTPDEAFAPVDPGLLKEWALYPVREGCNEIDPSADDACPPGPAYETGVLGDLAGVEVNYYVYLGRDHDVGANPNFTIRLTTISVDNPDPYGDETATGFPIDPGDYGNAAPAWVNTPAPALSTLIDRDGIIDIRDAAAGDALPVVLGDTNVIDSSRLTVDVQNLRTGEVEHITLVQDSELSWRYSAELPSNEQEQTGANDDGVLNVIPTDTVRVTYVDESTDGGQGNPGNIDVVKTDEAEIDFNSATTYVNIEKLTNGRHADGANDYDVPRIDVGDTVEWTYEVTNVSPLLFSGPDIYVSDSVFGVTPVFDPTSDDGDLVLSPAETWVYRASGAAVDLFNPPLPIIDVVPGCNDGRPTYQNLGRVFILGGTVSDEDSSHYCNMGDVDRDGVTDSLDNCFLDANGPLIPDAGGHVQRDTDGDDFGNVCDPDFDNNLIVNAADLAYLKTKFFSSDADADLNGDGWVNAADLAIVKTLFFGPPGPSGLVP